MAYRTTTDLRGSNIIDSRDVIARIEYLESERESELEDHLAAQQDLSPDDSPEDFEYSEQEELDALKALADEASDYCDDWLYGVTLISEDYFEQYAKELAEDIGALPDENQWPCTCIDWERAANEFKQEYTQIDFDGTTYYYR